MLLTRFSENINLDNPLNEYPRPQLKRESYINLNGKWDFKITDNDQLPEDFYEKIVVPFCVESYLSGIKKLINENDYIYYRKNIKFDKSFIKDKVILHFDAVDQHCKIYINRNLVIENNNGYLPFEVDIKPFLIDGENEILVQVKDELSHDFPYGKQRKDRGGMWYTPVSGIWQSVWIESVSNDYVKNLTITPNVDNNTVTIIANSSSNNFTLKIYDEEKLIYKATQSTPIFLINLENGKLWSPENPHLYDIELTTDNDKITSYFALRKFSVNDKHFLLNNKPYFVHGLLDQGYFPEGIYTPGSYKAYENDILEMKRLGFNCLRKHIKIEPMRFYYYCDKIGMLVFQDFVNSGDYSFFVDTALPTIGINKLAKLFKKVPEKQKEIFKKSAIDTLNYLYNIPSIVYYTIFNEGWGQHDADSYYKLVKDIEKTRVIDSTSGWFKENESDVLSLHVYFKKIKIKKSNKPIIVSEFGGYTYKEEHHIFNNEKDYGYGKKNSKEELNDAIYELYIEQIVSNIKNGLAGCIYTQVSDVEDEINGLLTYDRKICKVDEKVMLSIKEKINKEFYHE